MDKYNVPSIDQVDFSRVRLDCDLVRFGVKHILEALRAMDDETRSRKIQATLEQRDAYIAMIAETLEHDKMMMVWEEGVSGIIYKLEEAATNVIDIVLASVSVEMKG